MISVIVKNPDAANAEIERQKRNGRFFVAADANGLRLPALRLTFDTIGAFKGQETLH